MTIEENDFKLELNEFNDKFDLYLLHTINAKKVDKRREEFKISGYDMRLETCLHRIINYRIKNSNDTLSLKQYLKQYQEIKNDLFSVLKNNDLSKK